MDKCYAAIDIGSNAVRLLIKKREGDAEQEVRLCKELLLRVPLRLGFDVFARGEISEDKAIDLRRLMKAYRQLMKIYEVTNYRACATSAMREAKNGKALLKKILKDTGIEIEIISGREEALLIYNNHIECMEDRTGNYLYVDVGGGSTEINLLKEGKLIQSMSYNIGTVRMLTGKVKEATWQRLRTDLEGLVAGLGPVNIIGSGGNINKLYRLTDKADRRKKLLPVSSLQAMYDEMKPLSVEQRMERFGLKPDRADVIIPAAEIFLTIAGIVHAADIHVPVIGLADGIVDSLYAKDLEREGKSKSAGTGSKLSQDSMSEA